METRSPSDVALPRSLIGLVRLLALILALATFAALAFTLVVLIQAGPAALVQFGVGSLLTTWPTAIALGILIVGPFVSKRLKHPPYVGLTLLAVWILSATVYLVSDAPGRSLQGTVATLTWAATPLLPVFTLRTILALRSSLRPIVQLAIVITVALVFWWLTAPVGLAVGCFLGGSCI